MGYGGGGSVSFLDTRYHKVTGSAVDFPEYRDFELRAQGVFGIIYLCHETLLLN